MRAAAALLPLLLIGVSAARAQFDDARSDAIDMATVTVAHDVCGFDLSEAQEDTISKRRQALVDQGAMTSSEMSTIEAELASSMKRQVAEGFCKPGGAEAQFYRRKLDALGGG